MVCHSKPTQCQHLRWEVACDIGASHFVLRITGKSRRSGSCLQTRLGAGWVKGAWGIAWCWVFKLVGRFGSNSVSAPLRGRRLPAIFPKRCKAGGRAGSSGRWLPGTMAWGRALSVGGSSGGGRKAAVALGDAAWSFSVRRSFSGVGNLNLNLGWAAPGFSWGRLRLVWGGVFLGLVCRGDG